MIKEPIDWEGVIITTGLMLACVLLAALPIVLALTQTITRSGC